MSSVDGPVPAHLLWRMSSAACSPCDCAEDAQKQQVSSVLLLLQEATKLAAPADDESSRAAETPPNRPQVAITDSRSDFTGSFAVMRESECSSSPWEVMRLINQQCERLLRSGHEDRGQAVLDSPDTSETEAEASTCDASSARVSVSGQVYSSEHTELEETKEPDDLAQLIRSSTADEDTNEENTSMLAVESRAEDPTEGEPSVLSTGSGCALDFTSFLVSEGEAESAWLHLNTSENTQAHDQLDLNNNFLKGQTQDGRSRAQRKQPHPSRSPDPQDAEVRGVTFSMYPELDAGAGQSRLVITSNYRRLRRIRSRSRSLHTSQRSSSSEEESDSCSLARSKICASCCTRKTPLWRDAEDGTPLCNACGIRYKKYRVRCQQCWNIPKKEANTNSQCLKCGDLLKLKSSV